MGGKEAGGDSQSSRWRPQHFLRSIGTPPLPLMRWLVEGFLSARSRRTTAQWSDGATGLDNALVNKGAPEQFQPGS